MEASYVPLLAMSAFWLGACPFSVWVGKWALGKDIRQYGDGNPGAVNVFRAGGRESGFLALALDIGKGMPFVALAQSSFGLSEMAVILVGLGAILGHAFSPILRVKGGKSVAVTYGVLLTLPDHHLLIVFAAFMFFGFIFIEIDAWTVLLGPAGALGYLLVTREKPWESLFVLCVLIVFAARHFHELQTIPRHKGRLLHWLESRRRTT